MPLGESDLDILPNEDEIDPEKITEDEKYKDTKFILEIKRVARKVK